MLIKISKRNEDLSQPALPTHPASDGRHQISLKSIRTLIIQNPTWDQIRISTELFKSISLTEVSGFLIEGGSIESFLIFRLQKGGLKTNLAKPGPCTNWNHKCTIQSPIGFVDLPQTWTMSPKLALVNLIAILCINCKLQIHNLTHFLPLSGIVKARQCVGRQFRWFDSLSPPPTEIKWQIL